MIHIIVVILESPRSRSSRYLYFTLFLLRKASILLIYPFLEYLFTR